MAFISTFLRSASSGYALLSQRQIDKFWLQLEESLHLSFSLLVVILLFAASGIGALVLLCAKRPLPRLGAALGWFALASYLFFILHLLLFTRSANTVQTVQLIPFVWYEGGTWHESRIIASFANTLLFVPFGFLLKNKHHSIRWCLSILLLTTLSCEWVQYITLLGSFKTENIINTMLGGALGCHCYTKGQQWLARRKLRS